MRRYFHFFFFIGLGLLFLSFFLEWYTFQVFDSDHRLIVYWSYNSWTGWSTLFNKDSVLNNAFRPVDLALPIIINIVFVGTLAGALFSALFKDIETTEKKIESFDPYALIMALLLCLNLFYIVIFPMVFLIPHEFFFPFLIIHDPEADLTYWYAIGPGYILQILGFLLIFPYAIFYFLTNYRFRSPSISPERLIDKYIATVTENLDFDALIAQEELKLKTNSSGGILSDTISSIPVANRKAKKRGV